MFLHEYYCHLLHGAVLLEKLTGSAASQEIPRILRKPKVHRTHKCPPPFPILGQLHHSPTNPSHFLKIATGLQEQWKESRKEETLKRG